MPNRVPSLSPTQEAEQARQVVNVLARLETRIAAGRWSNGHRFAPDGGNCLIGAIDEATRWVQPGVAERVTTELVARLPAPFRLIGRLRPRFALASFNDTVGGRSGALDLVRRTRYALGGLPLIHFVGEDRAQPWVAIRQRDAAPVSQSPDRVIDLTDTWVARTPRT